MFTLAEHTIKMETQVDFEEAIQKTGFGRFNYILIFLSGCLMTCAFMELTAIGIVMPVAACELNLTTSDKGILGAIGYVGVILSSHLWGFLSDTRGRKSSLIWSLLIAFLTTFVSSFVNNFYVMVLLRFLNGFCISCAGATTFAYLGEFHNTRNRGRVLMIASILYSASSLIIPTFAILTINREWSFPISFINVVYKPWRFFILLCGIPNLLCAFILMFVMPESPKYTYSKGDEKKTLQILRYIYRMNTKNAITSYGVTGIIKNEEFGENSGSGNFFRVMWTQTAALFTGSHLKNILTACFLQFAVCLSANSFWTFFPEIMNKVNIWKQDPTNGPATVCEIFNRVGAEVTNTDHVTACVTKLEPSTFYNIFENVALYGVCYAIMSVTINRVGKLAIFLAIVLSTGLAAFSLMFVTQPDFITYTFVFLITAGLGISVVNASTVELFPTKMRAMAICVSMMVGRLGSVTGSVVIGFVINKYCSSIFLMPTVLLSVSAVLAFSIPNISKRIK